MKSTLLCRFTSNFLLSIQLSGSGGVSDYASVDSPSPSSVNPLVSSAVLHNIPPAYSSPAERPYPTPTLPSYDNLHFHSRTTLPLSSTSGASSSTVGSTTRLLGPRSSVSQNIRLLETRETTIWVPSTVPQRLFLHLYILTLSLFFLQSFG